MIQSIPEIDSLAAAREILAQSLELFRENAIDVNYYEKLAPGVNGALANLLQAEAQAKEAQNG